LALGLVCLGVIDGAPCSDVMAQDAEVAVHSGASNLLQVDCSLTIYGAIWSVPCLGFSAAIFDDPVRHAQPKREFDGLSISYVDCSNRSCFDVPVGATDVPWMVSAGKGRPATVEEVRQLAALCPPRKFCHCGVDKVPHCYTRSQLEQHGIDPAGKAECRNDAACRGLECAAMPGPLPAASEPEDDSVPTPTPTQTPTPTNTPTPTSMPNIAPPPDLPPGEVIPPTPTPTPTQIPQPPSSNKQCPRASDSSYLTKLCAAATSWTCCRQEERCGVMSGSSTCVY